MDTNVTSVSEDKTYTFKADDLSRNEWTLLHTIKLKLGVNMTNREFLLALARFYHRHRTSSTTEIF
jgi:hypothetical protein